MLITGQWDDPVLIQQKYIVADGAYHCTVTPSNRIPLYDCLVLIRSKYHLKASKFSFLQVWVGNPEYF